MEFPTVKWFRLRLSTLMWLVALVAAFLGGIRYGEYRAAARAQMRIRQIVLSPGKMYYQVHKVP